MRKSIKVETEDLDTLTIRRFNPLDRILPLKALDDVARQQTSTVFTYYYIVLTTGEDTEPSDAFREVDEWRRIR
jgi:hypothetical protein